MSDIVGVIDHFFNDIIAQIIPGFFYIILLGIAFDIPIASSPYLWITIVAISYLLGHLLLALSKELELIFERFKGAITSPEFYFKKKPIYSQFIEILNKQELKSKKYQSLILQNNLSFYDYRSIAMSLVSEGATLGRRFMFIHLCCKGTMMSVLLGGPFALVKMKSDFELPLSLSIFFAIMLVMVVIYPLQVRAKEFFERSMMIPFSCAVSEMVVKGYE